MLNLTFLFKTCGITEIQFIMINFVFTPNSKGLCQHFGVRTARTPVSVGCSNSYFYLDIPKIYNGLFGNKCIHVHCLNVTW